MQRLLARSARGLVQAPVRMAVDCRHFTSVVPPASPTVPSQPRAKFDHKKKYYQKRNSADHQRIVLSPALEAKYIAARDTSVQMLSTAKAAARTLSPADYLKGINACLDAHKPEKELAFWALDGLRAVSVVSVETYSRMIKFFSSIKQPQDVMALMDAFDASGYQLTESITNEVLTSLAITSSNRQSVDRMTQYFNKYSELRPTLGWRLPASTYLDVAGCYVKYGLSDHALNVLKSMTEAHHQPTALMCSTLLQHCLFHSDGKVLRVLASWYMNHFNHRLEFGQISRMLSVANSAGDGQLALLAFQMIVKDGYRPAFTNYVCLVRALLQDKDLISAVEALQEMETAHSIELNSFNARQHLNSLCELLVGSLGNTQRIDDLYYALVDQVQTTDAKVPRVVLDAMVIALGKQDQLDRAFASFQDYETVFKVQPTVDSYNALLQACSLAERCSIDQMLALLEAMDAASETNPSLKPDSTSYSILLEYIMRVREMRVLDPMVDHVLQSNQPLEARTWRRLAIHYSLKKNRARLAEILEKVKEVSPQREVPRYLADRVNFNLK